MKSAKPKRPADWPEWAAVCTKADERAVAEGCYPDTDAAERVRIFFRKFLRHSKGRWAKKPFELLPWQWNDVVAPLFGWQRPGGTRRFRRAYVEIGKKNGKSTLCAGLSLFLLIGDGEMGAEVYSAGTDRPQAAIIYREAEAMVGKSPQLSGHVECVPSQKRLVFPRTGSFYHALSADGPRQEGLNVHGLIFEELHAQKTRDLWDTLVYGGIAREQPLIISITTAGWDRNSICWEEHRYAEQVLDGTFDDWTFFPYIRAAGEDDDWTDPATWRKANPSFGVTMTEADFAVACQEAQDSAAKENAFRRYRLNIWTEQDVRWLKMDKWDACKGLVDAEALRGRDCFAGLDLSSKIDLTALVLVFPLDDGVYALLSHFWIPKDTAREAERRDRVPYTLWAKQGFVELTEGNVVDYATVIARTLEHAAKYTVQELAVDRYQAEHMMQLFAGEGLEVVPFGQGYGSMSAPTKEMERLVVGGLVRHGGNPVLRWMAGNAMVRPDAAGNLKPVKPDRSRSPARIDGIVASIMGLGRAMTTEPRKKSVYETRGLLRVGDS